VKKTLFAAALRLFAAAALFFPCGAQSIDTGSVQSEHPALVASVQDAPV